MPSGLSAALSTVLPAASTAEPALDGVAGWAVNLMETLGP
ncbi:MAG: hypothetical protein K0S43_782, partial [Cellulosimicrobium sp.]|nr:hypothetical protein [Cellulosimicrobium sp.]